jgi:hypothetical protein
MSQRDYKRGADRHNAMGKRKRGLRTCEPLPKLRSLEVYCRCGHRALISISRSAVPTLRCSKCGRRGLVSDFVMPMGPS